jgi:hypothetical protein
VSSIGAHTHVRTLELAVMADLGALLAQVLPRCCDPRHQRGRRLGPLTSVAVGSYCDPTRQAIRHCRDNVELDRERIAPTAIDQSPMATRPDSSCLAITVRRMSLVPSPIAMSGASR